MPPKSTILIRFGELIRHRRLELGLSQEDFALRTGLHRTYVGAIERGERNISLIKILQLCEALELSLIEFFTLVISDPKL